MLRVKVTKEVRNRLKMVKLRTMLETRPWSVLSWTAGIAAASFLLYFGLQIPVNNSVGAQFVLAEWPSPSVFPIFYAKPITWFSYLAFLYWTFGLESQKPHLLRLSPRIRRGMFIVAAVVAFGAFYEIFFNFTLWSALQSVTGVLTQGCLEQHPPSQCTPDILSNSYPSLSNPINLVFATKVVTTIFALAMYSLWFLNRLDRETEFQNSSPLSETRA